MPKKKLTQALPSVRPRANLKQCATREWKDRVTELAREAYCGPLPEEETTEPLDVVLAPAKIQELAEDYVSAKHYKVPLKEFRRITTKLRNNIHALLESIPPDIQPPFAQMRERFCGQGKATEDSVYATEDLWDQSYSSTAVKRVLHCWIKLMDELNEDAGGDQTPLQPRLISY